jgi:tagatose 1,6-diphosphate aldolase GatY/KbaY
VSVDAAALRRARSEGRALIGFSIYNLEQGLGVVRAAESVGVQVLLQAGSSAFRYAGREPLAALAVGLARSARVPVGVHLDHSTDLAEIDACLRLGYTSVMFDGSGLPLEQNVAMTCEVVRRARRVGAWVEAELAGIAGDEDASVDAAAAGTTDPEVAATFVAATGVDALAVAIGNVHGIGATPPALDLALLERIAEHVAVPLVLHGVSGLQPADVSAAIALGVAKLNVNTELRRALRDAVIATAADPPPGDSVAGMLGPAIAATQAAAADTLRAFSLVPLATTEQPS